MYKELRAQRNKGLAIMALGLMALGLFMFYDIKEAQTQSSTLKQVKSQMQYIKWDLTSDASGDVTANTTVTGLQGKVTWACTGVVAAASPTDNWDLVITDPDGYDILGGGGANRDNILREYVKFADLGSVRRTPLTCTVSNAGNAKQVQVIIYIDPS